MKTEPGKETYIGDGVYVSCDGWYLWLRTEREGMQHRIALEPESFNPLLRIASETWGPMIKYTKPG